MDNQAKNFSEAIQKRQRLPQRPAMPEVRDLLGLLAEAEKLRGKMLEVPWQEPGVPDLLVLCVEFEIGSTMPVWSLYQGDAGESRLVWSCRETDMYLLYDLLCMFMSQLRPKVPEPQPVAEASAGDAPQEVADNLTPIDYSLFAERPNVMLGYLLVGAGIIPDTLRRTYQRANPGSAKPAAKAEATPQPKPQQQAKPQSAPQPKAQAQPQPKPVPQPSVAASATRKDYSEAKQVCEFLLQAGIVSTEDVEAASRLKKREGGELELLVSAGTIDKRTHEAALSCWRMIKDNLLKTEQGIIALHYCQRMRVSLPEAFMELGWHYPK
jgi:pyruvate/2-oxoglutarate dehydrogenase complex dihydrolipoamide acyltransferase (E2) component